MKILYLLFYIFFNIIYSQIKINPIHLNVGRYPIVLSSNDNYYYILTDITMPK